VKVFVVATVARQVEGEFVFVRMEQGYTTASKADEHVKALTRQFTETISVPAVGPVPCFCERGVFEVEIDGITQLAEPTGGQ
jgi:hypothetical protein